MTALLFCSSLSAQNASRHGFGIYQSYLDHNATLLDGSLFAFDSSLSHTLRLGYQYRLSPAWQFHAGISNGFSLNQSIKDKYLTKAYTLSYDLGIMFRLDNGRLLKEDARVAPFASFAYRMDYVPKLRDMDVSPWVAYNQYGLGLNIRLGDFSQIQLYTGFDQKLGSDFNTLMHYRIGFNQNFGKRSENTRRPIETDVIVDNERIQDLKDSMALIINSQTKEIDSMERALGLASADADSKSKEVLALKDSLKNCASVTIRDTIVTTITSTVSVSDDEQPPFDLKFDSLGTQYYVIAYSTKKKKDAENLKDILMNDFEKVMVFEKDNGYFRVGVYGGNNLTDAQEVMKQVMRLGYAPVWISIE